LLYQLSYIGFGVRRGLIPAEMAFLMYQFYGTVSRS